MKKIILVTVVCISLVAGVFSAAYAMGKPLTTEKAQMSEVTGNFTVILYGGRYYKDIETVAFLVPERSLYPFEPYAPEFDYRVVKGAGAKDAFEIAEQFVGAHYAFLRSLVSRIVDENGRLVGYEVRPLYNPLAFGVEDVLDISYSITNGRVRAYVSLKPEIDRQLHSGDGSREGNK